MNLKKFYIEIGEDSFRADFIKNTYEVEECLYSTLKMNQELTNFKRCLKNDGVYKVLKKVEKNISVLEINDFINNKQRDLFANLKYLESETKIDRVRILIWLNEKYLETFNTFDESTTILNLAKHINAYYEQKRNISSI